MAIRKYKDGDDIKIGQFVNFSGLHCHSFASIACKVIAVKDKSIDIQTLTEDSVERQKLKRLISFVCDTQEESERMRDVSSAFLKAAMKLEDKLRLDLISLKQKMIDEATK